MWSRRWGASGENLSEALFKGSATKTIEADWGYDGVGEFDRGDAAEEHAMILEATQRSQTSLRQGLWKAAWRREEEDEYFNDLQLRSSCWGSEDYLDGVLKSIMGRPTLSSSR